MILWGRLRRSHERRRPVLPQMKVAPRCWIGCGRTISSSLASRKQIKASAGDLSKLVPISSIPTRVRKSALSLNDLTRWTSLRWVPITRLWFSLGRRGSLTFHCSRSDRPSPCTKPMSIDFSTWITSLHPILEPNMYHSWILTSRLIERSTTMRTWVSLALITVKSIRSSARHRDYCSSVSRPNRSSKWLISVRKSKWSTSSTLVSLDLPEPSSISIYHAYRMSALTTSWSRRTTNAHRISCLPICTVCTTESECPIWWREACVRLSTRRLTGLSPTKLTLERSLSGRTWAAHHLLSSIHRSRPRRRWPLLSCWSSLAISQRTRQRIKESGHGTLRQSTCRVTQIAVKMRVCPCDIYLKTLFAKWKKRLNSTSI